MTNALHRIRRLRWVVNTDSATEAFAMRQDLHHHWQELFLSACETAFDHVADSETVIRIPRLELRLSVASEAELMTVLPELIQARLSEQLQSLNQQPEWVGSDRLPLSHELTTSHHNAIDVLLHYLRTGSVPWQIAHMAPEEIAVTLRQTCHHHHRQLLDYLCHTTESTAFYFRLFQLLPETDGSSTIHSLIERQSLNWGSVGTQIVTAVLAAGQSFFTRYQQHHLIATFLSGHSRQQGIDSLSGGLAMFVAQVRQLSEPERFYVHLLQSLPQSDWLPLINMLSEWIPLACRGAVMQVMTRVLSSESFWFSQNQKQRLLAAFLLEGMHAREPDRPPDGRIVFERVLGATELRLLQSFISGLPASTAMLFPATRPIDRPSSLDSPDGSTLLDASESAEQQPADGRSDLLPIPPTPSTLASAPLLSDEANSLQIDQTLGRSHETDVRWSGAIATPVSSSSSEFPISVRYAGLILIHPFIPHFFEAVGVKAAHEKTISPEMIARAAALLHFLATGIEAIYEYELDLIKVLLGLAPTMPLLVTEGFVQASDREETTALLQSVIEYWSALKNTSVAGLRASFLQRSGLLSPVEDGWRLQVEPQTFDLLLNHLPWTISIVKFPWMPQPIYTEWLTP